MKQTVDAWFDQERESGDAAPESREVLNTAMVIVWIEVRCADSRQLWRLAIQKARRHLGASGLGMFLMEELISILRHELLDSDEDENLDTEREDASDESSGRPREGQAAGDEENGALGSGSVEQTPSKNKSVMNRFSRIFGFGKKNE
jgi:hypothetical protein